MAIEVSCSNCGEDFRVKDDAAGKSFKCKVCGTKVRIPEIDDEDAADDFPPPRRRSRDENDGEDRPKRRKKKSSSAAGKTLGPAIGLFVTGGLSLFGMVFRFVVTILNPGSALPKPPPNVDQAYIIGQAVGFYGVLIGLLITGLLILYGAYCLRIHRFYAMALTACILASIPCISPGCVLGIPFGIWGWVVLVQDDVKRAFR